MIKVALLTTDSREHFKDYGNPQPYFGTAPEALLEGFKTMPKEVEVHVVSCLQKVPISSPEKLAGNIYYHALHVPNIGWMKTGYLGCSRAVRRRLRQIQPDIVHGQGTERDCAISAVRSGYPNVLTIHGNMRLIAQFLRCKPLTYYWFATKLERHCLAKTCGVVAISSYTQSNVAPYTRRTWLVPNAVHPSFFHLPRQPDLTPRILCAANIGSRKNQIGLIKSLESLAATRPIKLIFAGGGSEVDTYFRKFIQLINEHSWCEYLGALNTLELQKQMAVAYMGILPSYEDNCPMVILEAAAAKLPFAASAVGGIPDLIKDGKTGLLFNPEHPESMTKCVRRLLEQQDFLLRLSSEAHTQAVERFAADAVASKHLRIYRDTLDSLIN
jgi:glycosyltransferase involved in cell wall biosynthesis